MHTYAYYAIKRHFLGTKVMYMMALGDDNLMVLGTRGTFDKDLFMLQMEDKLRHTAMVPKFQHRQSIDLAEYCSGRFYPTLDGRVWGPKIGRLLWKLGYVKNHSTAANMQGIYKGTLLSLQNTISHVPVLRSILKRGLLQYSGVTPIYTRNFEYKSLAAKTHVMDEPAMVAMMDTVYKVTWEYIELVERVIEETPVPCELELVLVRPFLQADLDLEKLNKQTMPVEESDSVLVRTRMPGALSMPMMDWLLFQGVPMSAIKAVWALFDTALASEIAIKQAYSVFTSRVTSSLSRRLTKFVQNANDAFIACSPTMVPALVMLAVFAEEWERHHSDCYYTVAIILVEAVMYTPSYGDFHTALEHKIRLHGSLFVLGLVHPMFPLALHYFNNYMCLPPEQQSNLYSREGLWEFINPLNILISIVFAKLPHLIAIPLRSFIEGGLNAGAQTIGIVATFFSNLVVVPMCWLTARFY